MVQLINKGGFRERANRSQKYKQSENLITTLQPNQYQPTTQDDKETTSPLSKPTTQEQK